jgi:hypothetical protein
MHDAWTDLTHGFEKEYNDLQTNRNNKENVE